MHKKSNPNPKQADNRRLAKSVLLGVGGAMLLASPAFAQADPSGAVQGVIDMLSAGWARGLAVLAIMVCGFMALTGRLNMMHAFSVVVGIAIIFGAPWIADQLGAGA